MAKHDPAQDGLTGGMAGGSLARCGFFLLERIESVHVRHDGLHFSQADDQCFDFFGSQFGQQPLLSLKRGNNDLVMERLTGARQLDQPRSVVFGVGHACRQTLFVERVETSADSAFIEADGIDDLDCADVRHSGEHAHHAPFGDAESEVLPICVGSAARESVGNIGEEVGNVPLEVEHLASFYRQGSPTNILLHERCSKIDQNHGPLSMRRRRSKLV